MTELTAETIPLAAAVHVILTHRRLEIALRAYDLTPMGLTTLVYFADKPTTTVGECSRSCRIVRNVLDQTLDRLVRNGLVTRARFRGGSPADGRKVFIVVTERGREVLASLSEIEIQP